MIQRILLSGCTVAIASLVALPMQAQQSPAQRPTQTPAPTTAQPVTQAEVRKFANAVKQALTITRSSEAQVSQTIQGEGFTEQRFDEIYRSQNDPRQKPSKPVDASEQQKYNRVIAKLVQLRKDNETKVTTAVKNEGLDLPRFNQIFAAVRQDPQLRQQVQQLIRQ